jgi:hypothetical protein
MANSKNVLVKNLFELTMDEIKVHCSPQEIVLLKQKFNNESTIGNQIKFLIEELEFIRNKMIKCYGYSVYVNILKDYIEMWEKINKGSVNLDLMKIE